MEINKPIMRILKILSKRECSIKDLSRQMDLSLKETYQIIKKLEKLNFIKRIKKEKITCIDLADVSFAQKFKELIHTMTHVNFEDFLYGLNFRILSYCLFDWKKAEHIAEQLNTSTKAIQNRISILENRGLLSRHKTYVKLSEESWPKLYSFLKEYRMFSTIKGTILWKFENEILYESDIKGKGSLTGFANYGKFGIEIMEPPFCYYLPEKKLSKEEIFIHSILEIENPRDVALAFTFFVKQNLFKKNTFKQLKRLSLKYECYYKLFDIFYMWKLIETEYFYKNRYIPKVTRREIMEVLKLYNVKEKRYFKVS